MGGHLLHGGLYSFLILLKEIQTKLGQMCQLLHGVPPSFLLLLKERQTGLGERQGWMAKSYIGVLYSFLPLLKESDPSERNTNRDRRDIWGATNSDMGPLLLYVPSARKTDRLGEKQRER